MIKRCMVALLLGCGLGGTVDAETASENRLALALEVGPGVATALAARVSVALRLDLEAMLREVTAEETKTAGETARVVVRADAPAGGETRAVQVERRTVIIYAGALRAWVENEEAWLRRAERETLRGLAELAGVPVGCPNAHCCLYPTTSLDESDMIGRGYCPPCQGQVQRHLRHPVP